MLMFVTLAALVAVLLRRDGGLRLALVRASIYWAVAATLSAELLGSVRQLGPLPVAAAWVAGLAALTIADPRWPLALGRAAEALGGAIRRKPLVSVVVLALAGSTLFTALVSAPNNWDSLTYHLARVEHWIQNGTLAHYRTNIEQQISFNPGAEILILHSRLLSGSDHYVNLVQWVAFVVSAAAASLVARRLGGNEMGQVMTGLFVLTFPMGILQASSTQNDLVTGCWIIVLAERLLAFRAVPSALGIAEVGAALGLALVTKGTALVAAFPLGCWMLLMLWPLGFGRFLRYAAVAGTVALALNAGWWMRNYQVFGSPLGTLGGFVGNATHGLDVVYSNAVRGLSSQILTPSMAANARIYEAAAAVVRVAGVDPEDPGTTMGSFRSTPDVGGWSRVAHEDLAASPVHTVVILGGMAWAMTRRQRSDVLGYAFVIVGAGLLYCVVLRWQLWIARLHVPLFLLAAPIAGLALGAWRPFRVATASAVMLIASLPALLFNETRPLLPRSAERESVLTRSRVATMFANLPPVQRSYEEGVRAVAALRPRELGLILEEGCFEYAVWYLLRQQGEMPRLTHLRVAVDVRDPLGPSAPDAFLAIDVEPDLPGLQAAFGPIREVGRWGGVVVLRRAEQAAPETAPR